MGRRINEGDVTGMKQDRFRHSKYEMDKRDQSYEGVSRAGANTLNGPYAENRGRRGDTPRRFNPDSPFENGRVSKNWGHRKGWDDFYSEKSFRPGRHGGAILNNDENDHTGRGPKGYKRLDDSIFNDVCETLSLSPHIDASDVEVEVRDGVVFLKGSVSDREAKRFAEYIIENIPGVHDVQNLLTFSRGERYAQKH